jgi:hypothetical protein
LGGIFIKEAVSKVFLSSLFCYSEGGAFAPLFKEFLKAALQAEL